MTDKQLEPCSMGVGCDEVGICYANAHGKPENCPKQRSEDVDLASRLFAFAGITPDCPHNPGFSHLNYFARELVLEAAKALRQPTQSDADLLDAEGVKLYWYRQGKDDGVEQERAKIVAWLRKEAIMSTDTVRRRMNKALDQIEAGEHLQEQSK